MSDAALIGVDWGTTNFRALLIDAGGQAIDRLEAETGILSVPGGDFAACLQIAIAPWRHHAADLPVLMAGMVGSRQGWVETAYLPCPAAPAALADGLAGLEVAGMERVAIVPGLSAVGPAGTPEVMRGEEVQILGAGVGSGLVCLPGTHSKWARLDHGTLTGFTTYMTGESYALFRHHSLLGRMIVEGAPDMAAFGRGVAVAQRPGGLTHHLFSVRTEALLGDLGAGAGDYLSGLLIGHELRHALADTPAAPVTLIGAPALCERYAAGLSQLGHAARIYDSLSASARGLARLAAAAGWIAPVEDLS